MMSITTINQIDIIMFCFIYAIFFANIISIIHLLTY